MKHRENKRPLVRVKIHGKKMCKCFKYYFMEIVGNTYRKLSTIQTIKDKYMKKIKIWIINPKEYYIFVPCYLPRTYNKVWHRGAFQE